MNARELAVLLAMCLAWGFHFVVVKTAVDQLPPIFYAAIRMTLVAALLSPFLRWRPGHMIRVLSAGACLGAFNYALMFTGLKHATASAAAIAIELYTPFAVILAVAFLGDRLGPARILGIALAFLGVAIIALGKPDAAGPETRIGLGVGLVACGAFMEAVGAILVKQSRAFRPIELLAWFAVVGTAALWSMTFAFESNHGAAFAQSDKTMVVGAVLYSAIAASIFGHTAYYWLLHRLPVSVVASTIPLTTFIAVLAGVLLLGDPFGPRFIIGGLMTVGGVGLVLLRNAAKQDIKRPMVESEIAP